MKHRDKSIQYTVRKSGRNQIHTENRSIGEQRSQSFGKGLAVSRCAEFQILHIRADRGKQRIRAQLKCIAVVIHAHQIPQPSRKYSRNCLKIRE